MADTGMSLSDQHHTKRMSFSRFRDITNGSATPDSTSTPARGTTTSAGCNNPLQLYGKPPTPPIMNPEKVHGAQKITSSHRIIHKAGTRAQPKATMVKVPGQAQHKAGRRSTSPRNYTMVTLDIGSKDSRTITPMSGKSPPTSTKNKDSIDQGTSIQKSEPARLQSSGVHSCDRTIPSRQVPSSNTSHSSSAVRSTKEVALQASRENQARSGRDSADFLRISAEIEKERRIIQGADNLVKATRKHRKIRRQVQDVKGTAEAKLKFYNKVLDQIMTVGHGIASIDIKTSETGVSTNEQSSKYEEAPATPARRPRRSFKEAPRKSPKGVIQADKKLGLNDFHFLAVLGRGNFGKVMLAEAKKSKELMAIKCIKKTEIISREEIDSMVIERNVFRCVSACRHPFLVSLYATFQTESHICFAMEYTPGGDLLTHIQNGTLDENRAKFYAACAVLGIKFLHENSIIYRDLKLDNLLLDSNGFVKIADYGLCKEGITYGDRTSTFCGTPEFIAPEMLTQNEYTLAVDWWGIGILIFEMLVGEAPFPGETEKQIFESIVHDEVEYPFYLAMATSNIIRKLLQKNPSKRLGSGPAGAADVMQHAYFRSIDWKALVEQRVRPPYVPKLTDRLDCAYFDKEFTRESPALTLPGRSLTHTEQEMFEGFSFTEQRISLSTSDASDSSAV